MNRLTRVLILTIVPVLLSGMFAFSVHAQGLDANSTGLDAAAKQAGYDTGQSCVSQPGGCIAKFAGAAINAVSALLGAVFFGLILYGGFLYLTSRGDEKATKKARETIANAVIGLLIIAISYSVADFVLNQITQITSAPTTSEETIQ